MVKMRGTILRANPKGLIRVMFDGDRKARLINLQKADVSINGRSASTDDLKDRMRIELSGDSATSFHSCEASAPEENRGRDDELVETTTEANKTFRTFEPRNPRNRVPQGEDHED